MTSGNDHPHGDVRRYWHGPCRCELCRAAQTAHAAQRRKLIAYGRWDRALVDAQPSRDHIATLRAAGMSIPDIVRATGIPEPTLARLIWNKRAQRITTSRANRILATQPSPRHEIPADLSHHLPHAFIPGRGVRRRLEALAAIGWSASSLEPYTGIYRSNLARLRRSDVVTVAVHLRVAETYELLWNRQPPTDTPGQRGAIVRARACASRAGYLPPLAWDDIDNDAEPPAPKTDRDDVDELAVDLAIAGEHVALTRAERLVAVERLHPRRWSDELVAAHLGVSERTILRDRHDLGLEAWPQHELVRLAGAA